MLSSSEIIKTVSKKIEEYKIERLVVDPVMVAKGGAMLIRQEARNALIEKLLPLAFVITPNVPEAEELSGIKITTVDDMKKASEIICRMGPKNVFLKGGHMSGDALDVFYDGKYFHEFSSERIDTKNTHGTGCTTSAAIATGLAQDMDVYEAIGRAKEYITEAIRSSLPIGSGHGPTNHMASVFKECERYNCIMKLKDAAKTLKNERCGNIIPEIQSNFVYALPQARKVGEVAAFPGRIVRVGDNVETLHDPEFTSSSHVAAIVLTVMRYDETFRSAMNIRFSEDLVKTCIDAGYDVDCFSRADEPKEVKEKEGSSLEWGTNHVLSKRDTIPDAIFDRGDVGKEPVIRILGQTPAIVAEKVLNISKKMQGFL
jgi:hydroxymethylpyrimidine/phosphomethylpyrimidine kinase